MDSKVRHINTRWGGGGKGEVVGGGAHYHTCDNCFILAGL